MGFEIMIEVEAGGTSSKVNQFDEDGKLGTFAPAPNTAAVACSAGGAQGANPTLTNPPNAAPFGAQPCPSGTLPVGVVNTGIPSFNSHNQDAYFGDARRVAWRWPEGRSGR